MATNHELLLLLLPNYLWTKTVETDFEIDDEGVEDAIDQKVVVRAIAVDPKVKDATVDEGDDDRRVGDVMVGGVEGGGDDWGDYCWEKGDAPWAESESVREPRDAQGDQRPDDAEAVVVVVAADEGEFRDPYSFT